MKKRLLATVLALITVLACAFNVLACGSPDPSPTTTPDDGTYYIYQSPDFGEDDCITITNGKVTDAITQCQAYITGE